MKELWRPVRGYVGLYEVSNFGRIRSMTRLKNNSPHKDGSHKSFIVKGQQMKLTESFGYLLFYACRDGVKKWLRVHQAAAQAFILNPRLKRFVNHKDGNKKNNNISNLEWVSHAENELHATINGLKAWGERNHCAKLTQKKVLKIRRLRESGMTFQAIGNIFRVTKQNVIAIYYRQTWKQI